VPEAPERQTTPHATEGINNDLLAQMDQYARTSHPPITGLLVQQHGKTVFENYYRGFDSHSYFNVYSITKSVTSALVGRALQLGLIAGLDQSLLELLPGHSLADDDPAIEAKRGITLRHVLSMTSGFDPEATNLEILWRSDDVIAAALQRPLAQPPGTSFFYDDVTIHLASVILARLTGMSTAAFAEKELFRPLGIWSDGQPRFIWRENPEHQHIFNTSGGWPDDGLPWNVDGFGNNIGAFGLHLRLRDMTALGSLYANGGMWDGVQLIPQDFVTESTRRQSAGGPPVRMAYGYGWWIPEPHAAFFATGLGPQTIHVVPGLNLVTAFTTHSNEPEGAHRRQLIEGFIIPAVTGAPA
jgi:CubicO group peptidase (beta-lactamase class C family)